MTFVPCRVRGVNVIYIVLFGESSDQFSDWLLVQLFVFRVFNLVLAEKIRQINILNILKWKNLKLTQYKDSTCRKLKILDPANCRETEQLEF